MTVISYEYISYPVGPEGGRHLNAQVNVGGMKTERNATSDLRGMLTISK